MPLTIVPLGGLGEFGANSLLLADGAGRTVLVDAGAAFSTLGAYGVAFEVPDFGALADRRPIGVVLTHGHDDHIRGLDVLTEAFPDLSILATRATLARADRYVTGRSRAMTELREGAAATLAGVHFESLPVSHSLPGTVALRMRCEDSTVVLATDLRLAPSALGETTSCEALARWGDEGVDLVLADATNVLVTSEPPAERVVAATFAELVRSAEGAVVAVTFASHAGRLQQLAMAAVSAGRVIVPVGLGLLETIDVQTRLGALKLSPGVVAPARDLSTLPHDAVVVLATGSQGEGAAAFPQIAHDHYPGFRLVSGDLVLHAARVIPGNEIRLARLFDDCVRRGARVLTATDAPLHASGHAHRREIQELLALLRPRWVVPIHGRRRHFEALAGLARHVGLRALIVENGQEFEVRDGETVATGVSRGVGRLLFEDAGPTIDPVVVRTRRSMARDGAVVAVLSAGVASRQELPDPHLHVVGLVLDDDTLERFGRGLGAHLRSGRNFAVPDPEILRSTMARWLQAELRRTTRRCPAVIAVVLE